jgi:hypothetical protein
VPPLQPAVQGGERPMIYLIAIVTGIALAVWTVVALKIAGVL